MNNNDPNRIAGRLLKKLIAENYSSQEEFAFQFGADIRTVSRYINEGINRVNVIQELAEHFNVDFLDFFKEEGTE